MFPRRSKPYRFNEDREKFTVFAASSEDCLGAARQEGQDFEAELAALDEQWQGGHGKSPIGPNYLTERSPGETYWVADYKGRSHLYPQETRETGEIRGRDRRLPCMIKRKPYSRQDHPRS